MFDDELADPHGLRPHFPIEIRFSAADDIWLSPSSGQPACWIGIVQYKCAATAPLVCILHAVH